MAGTERRHLWLTGVLAAILLGITAAVAVPLWTGGRLASEAAPPGPPLAPPPCPTATGDDFDHMWGDRKGPLVPAGAGSGVVCAYTVVGEDVTFKGVRALRSATVTQVVAMLNTLPPEPPSDHSGDSVTRACFLVGRDQYRVVFAYRDGGSATVDVSLNCGTVHHDGAVRFLHNAKKLLQVLQITP